MRPEGINIGLNLGNSMWHSGTLAGAKQAALMGSRGIALSAPGSSVVEADFELLKPFVREVLALLVPDNTLPLVNVNFPVKPRGMLWTGQSVRHYDGKVVPIKDPMGRQLYWFMVVPIEAAVITHSDQDHYGGFQDLFESDRFRFATVYHNGIVERTGTNPLGKRVDDFLVDVVTNDAELDATPE